MCMHVCVHENSKCLFGCLGACDCAEATRILSCHIRVNVLEEKKSRPSGWFVVHAYTLDWVGKNNKLYCFCQNDTRTKATTCSLAACPLCKAV